ncbi:hypothetical protein FTX61_16225 [Nitriliruptoraceae bacterium ZYF776]|nr:hypothetical protein [Profundirhabdus halotolerans]
MARDPRSDERRLAGRLLALLGVLGAGAAGVGALVAGGGGALSAAIGVGLAALLFGMSAGLLVWAADRGHGAAIGVFVTGAAVRVVLYTIVLNVLAGTTWVHRPSLAIATGVALAVTLAAELVWLARMPRLFWVDPSAARPTTTDDSRLDPGAPADSRLEAEATVTRS